QVRIGDREPQFVVHRGAGAGDFPPLPVAHDGFQAFVWSCRGAGAEGEAAGVEVRGDVEIGDVRGGDRLQPHGLPNTGGTGVEDPARRGALFAHRVRGLFVPVLGVDLDLLLVAGCEGIGDVGA